jgi:hypothetical protein
MLLSEEVEKGKWLVWSKAKVIGKAKQRYLVLSVVLEDFGSKYILGFGL